jgi:hypothetical protein
MTRILGVLVTFSAATMVAVAACEKPTARRANGGDRFLVACSDLKRNIPRERFVASSWSADDRIHGQQRALPTAPDRVGWKRLSVAFALENGERWAGKSGNCTVCPFDGTQGWLLELDARPMSVTDSWKTRPIKPAWFCRYELEEYLLPPSEWSDPVARRRALRERARTNGL